MNIPSFQHVTPALRLFHGPDSLGQLGRELERLNSRRAVIFCGASLARQGTLLDLVRAAAGERCAGVFAAVRAHSPLVSVEAAADALRSLEADAVIAVGGGSAIVTARAAGILLAEQGPVRNLCTTQDEHGKLHSPRLLAPKLPQLVIPTTPTTAIVKAGSTVFDPDSGQRLPMFDPKTRVKSVFIHPALLQSAPRKLVISASLNALAMAIEGLSSRSGDPLSDAPLMHALRLLAQHLADPSSLDEPAVRGELVLAAVMCGQGTDHTGAGITSVLGHAIGARHELDNGVANAIVLPYALHFNAASATAGLGKVATALGLPRAGGADPALATINVLAAMFEALDTPRRLRDVNVPHEALADIAATAIGDWFLGGNPRPVRAASELQQVLEQAW